MAKAQVGQEEMAQDTVQDSADTQETKSRKRKVMTKDLSKYPGKLVITVVGVDGELVFDPKDLPQEIQDRLPAFALNHRLGDAAAGKAGQEAVDSINKVWEGMMANNWSVRAPAAKKVNLNTLAANLDKLDPAEQEATRKALEAIGIKL